MNQIGLSEFYRGKSIFLTGSTGILNVRKMKYFFKVLLVKYYWKSYWDLYHN